MSDQTARTGRMTAKSLLTVIRDERIYTDRELVELLGEERHRLTLTTLEAALERSGRIRPARLLELKAQASGYPALPIGSTVAGERLDERVSRGAGAILLSRAPDVVALVEDSPEAVGKVEEALGGGFQAAVMLLSQFRNLHAATYGGEKAAEEARTLTDVYHLFDEMERRRASDLHLSVGAAPAVRVDGSLVTLPYEAPDPEWMRNEVVRIAGPDRAVTAEEDHNVDFAFSFGDARYRVNVGSDQHGRTIAARRIPGTVPKIASLGIPQAVRDLVHLPRGLVLVTGPTGSGKSTTLAAMLQEIADTQAKHIITLEDPIEFHLEPRRATIHQRELGSSFNSFSGGLRQALRQDPDVVLVGEMRDLETMRTALTAAETGHLVFGTMHTYDAASTVARMVTSFPAEEQDQVRALLAVILRGIVSQTLLPAAGGTGRVAAFEVLLSTPAVAANLRKVDGHAAIRQTMEVSVREGMQTMDLALAELVRRRMVTLEEAETKAVDIEELRKRAS